MGTLRLSPPADLSRRCFTVLGSGFTPRRMLVLVLLGAAACSPTAGIAESDSPIIDREETRLHLRWDDARQAVGREAAISGKIINVGSAGRVNFLNFDKDRPPKFTGIVFREDLENFSKPLVELYQGKIVRIRGFVTLFRDRPQIVIKRPDQIEILDALPEVAEPPAGAEVAREVDPSRIRLATYNVLNLFDDEDDPYHADETTRPKPRDELERLAASIRALDADVIALQEVESRGYLERFLTVFLPEMNYKHVVHYEGNDLRGIDVSLVSRLPIGPVRSHRHMSFTGPDGIERQFNRDLLAVTVQPPGDASLEVWVVHLKSNSGGREAAEPIRLAEAEAIRRLLDDRLAADPEAWIAVVGDYNDVWGSPTLTTIVGQGPLSLWSPASSLEGPAPDTYNRGEHQSMIDFILCSPALAKRYVPGTLRVPPGSQETTGSDHNPVAATFDLQ